ncbi:peptidase [Labilibaculum filiforme]|uniref:Peptidase n=1 Tax=Labilibaculum filiforme TaxID=1940526 RepID=A0A2N3HV84_9BACT|nr:murein L,D-transpeptidase catalytic domain family protein [Labilibaculum filiforme]PKQ61970.1 peptidase [Labilibaculum filiforme]
MQKSYLKIIFLSLITLGFTPVKYESSKYYTKTKADAAYQYCRKNGFSTEFCLLVDMSIHSGKNRLFIYDFKKDSIVDKGLCAHGCGVNKWGTEETKTNPKFSNVDNSHCTSVGKYKIGKRGYSNWGININYKLHGLEDSNDNAYSRIIVLHAWDMVSEEEIFPVGTPEGWGCPAVSNGLMRNIDSLLKNSSKPVLLWVYE